MRLRGNDVGLVEKLRGGLVELAGGGSNGVGYGEEYDFDQLSANRL